MLNVHCTCVHVCVCTHAHMCVQAFVCVCVHVCTCVCVRVYYVCESAFSMSVRLYNMYEVKKKKKGMGKAAGNTEAED